MVQKLAFRSLEQNTSEPPAVTMSGVSPRIRAKLKEFMSLEPNWDGHQGRATDPTIAEFAVETLGKILKTDDPEPFLAPGGDGTMQAEWDGDSYAVELHFVSDKSITACRKNYDTGEWETAKVSRGNLSEISKWVESISCTATK